MALSIGDSPRIPARRKRRRRRPKGERWVPAVAPELSERVRDVAVERAGGGVPRPRIHVFERHGIDPPLLLLHGFPSSSFDWRALLELEPDRAVLAFDFLGFGLSDKPRDHVYSLGWQADLVEHLVHEHLGRRAAYVVAHDMGTSVTTELLARDVEGRLGFELAGALLFNGSMILERATLEAGAAACCAARSARWRRNSATRRCSAARSAASSPTRIRSARRRPRTSGRSSATTAGARSATSSSTTWASAPG